MDDRVRENVDAALLDLSAVLRDVCADHRAYYDPETGTVMVQQLRHIMYCVKLLAGIVDSNDKYNHNNGAGGVVILPDVACEEQDEQGEY